MTSQTGGQKEGLQGDTSCAVPMREVFRSLLIVQTVQRESLSSELAISGAKPETAPTRTRWADRNDHACRQRQLDDMEKTKTQNGRRRPEGDASEFGVVRVFSKPAPDAEDRLRRLFTLLLKPQASDSEAASEKVSHPDDLHNGHREAEA